MALIINSVFLHSVEYLSIVTSIGLGATAKDVRLSIGPLALLLMAFTGGWPMRDIVASDTTQGATLDVLWNTLDSDGFRFLVSLVSLIACGVVLAVRFRQRRRSSRFL